MNRNWLRPLRVRALFFGACSLFAANVSWALGLGEIELDSALNERLNARIELLDASGLQPAEIIVSLASNEDFQRVGVERFFFLTDLRFEVTYGAGGAATVLVTSSQAITEPYLNFLVEVLWPSGRLLKEYTVLLDPPTFSEAAAPAVSAPRQESVASETAGRVRRATATTGTQVQLTPPEPSTGPPPRSPLDDELMTDRDDTLWKIAERTVPAQDITVHQNMLAIQRLNPKAFIRNNINLLKAGYVLRLPDAAEARALSQREALAEVAAQNDEWRTGRSRDRAEPATQVADTTDSGLGGQLDARAAPAPAAPAAQGADGELRIVAGQGDSATGMAASDSGRGELDAALEETDRLSRELDELTYQMDREKELAQSQLEVKDRQLEVKDQEIAELQAQLAAMREQAASAPGAQSQDQSAAPKSETPWWQSTAVMGGAAGVLVLALVGGLIMARRRRETEDEFYAAPEAQEARIEPGVAEADATLAEVEEAETEEDLEAEAETYAAEEVAAFDEEFDEEEDSEAFGEADVIPEGSQTGDVIAEADIYIAYGRYPQATGLLLGVLEEDPDRNDVRLKLLEIFAETHDEQSFETHLAEFVERCDDQEALLTARELEARLGEDALGEETVLGAEAAKQQPPDARMSNIDTADAGAQADVGAQAGELELSDAAETLDTEEVSLETESALEELGAEIGAEAEDFELELDSDEGAGDQLGGDLGIDFDPDAELDEDLDLVAGVDAGADLAEALEDSEVATAEEEDFDFDDEGDSANTKLDLARAYIDMGDEDGARDILSEVLEEGSAEQQQQAQALLENL